MNEIQHIVENNVLSEVFTCLFIKNMMIWHMDVTVLATEDTDRPPLVLTFYLKKRQT